MNISSDLNTVSSSYGQQKGNQMKTPASGEKTFYTAETPKVYQIFHSLPNYSNIPDMLDFSIKRCLCRRFPRLCQFSCNTI